MERQPPQSLEAEMCTLGAMLIKPESFHEIAGMLDANDFTVEAHRIIYAAFVAMFNTNQPIDLTTIGQFIADLGQIERVTYTYLATLINTVPTSLSISSYAKTVKEKSIRRQLLSAAFTVQDRVYDESEDLEKILAESQNKVFEIMPFKTTKDDSSTIINELEQVQKEYDEKKKQGEDDIELQNKIAKLTGEIQLAESEGKGKDKKAEKDALNAQIEKVY